ncbi:MAG: MFS transporter [Firmicutes bacterium]|nr:MFS transporter [Bacillota bacterium]
MAMSPRLRRTSQVETEETAYVKDRNYYGILIEGILFFIASNISLPATVLTAFARELGASPVIIGITPSLLTIGWLLPQLLSASYVERLERRKPYILLMSGIHRSSWLFLAAVVFIFRGVEAALMLWIFLGIIFASSLFDGMSAAAWTDFVARVIPNNRRGSLFATRAFVSGFLGLGAGWLSSKVLATGSFPTNFALLFLLSFFFYGCSWVTFAFATKEPPAKKSPLAGGFITYWQNVPRIFRSDRRFLSFIIAMTLLTLGTMALAFFTVAGLERLDLPTSYAGHFTILMTAGQILATTFCGQLADRYGHKVNFILSALACGTAVTLPLFPASLNLYRAAFLFLGASMAFTGVSRLAIVMEYAPETMRATYAGILNTWLAPITLLAPAIGGSLAGAFGYNATFIGALAANVLALLWLVFLVQDPRKAQQREVNG